MHFLSRENFNVSVVCAPPCLDLLVKWLRASGLSAVPCRTRGEFEAGPFPVVVVEQSYNYPDDPTPPLRLAQQQGASSCISFHAHPMGSPFEGSDPEVPQSLLGISAAEQGFPHTAEQGDFYLPQQLGRLIFHLRTLGEARAPLPDNQVLALGSLLINPLTREVCTGDGEVTLTALQFDLLVMLARSPGRVFSTDDLQAGLERLQTVRKDPSVVRYHVARLRARLGRAGRFIENVRGCGYRARELLLE